MKNQIVALSVVTLILLTGCEEKQQPSSSASKELPPSVQRPIEATKEVKKESAKQLPVVESKTVQQATPVATKQTAEESLAEVAKHGREVTKTQVSKSRTRAQQAEDEMLKEMSAHK